MAKLHLVVGPVGAGKSTFALGLCRTHKAVRLNLDEWMAQLFGPDRPEDGALAWYLERSERCMAQIWTISTRILDAGSDVVLEVGLIQEGDRRRFYTRVEDEGIPLTVYVLDAPRKLRRERVKRRNLEQGETYSMVVPPAVFEHASDRWEPPDDAECAERDIRFIGSAGEQGESR